MLLGDLAWEIKPQPQERERLGTLLSDEAHIARKIFIKYARKTKGFTWTAKSLQKNIKGFRPGTDAYNSRAVDYMLGKLAVNKAPKVAWNIYQETIASFFEYERPAMHAMMLSVDVEVGEGCTNGELSHEFLKATCEQCAEFDVHDLDIDLLYELWPIERLDDYEKLLKSCPKFDRVKVVETAVYELQEELSKRKKELSETIEKIVSKKVADVHLADSVKKEEQKLQKHADEFVDSKFRKLSGVLETSITNFEEKLNTLGSEYQDIQSAVDGLTAAVDRGRADIEALVQSMESLDSPEESREKDAMLAESTSQLVTWQRKPPAQPALGEVPEDEFLIAYITLCESTGLDQSEETLRAAHCLLKSAPVICSSDSMVINAWTEALGWNELGIRLVASPTWSNPDEWIRGQRHLAADTADPRIVYLFDYDAGLVEAYLNPPLRLWSEYDFANASAKLYLISSTSNREMRAPVNGEVQPALKAPVIYLDQLVDCDLIIRRRLPRVSRKDEREGITRLCLESWINSSDELQSMLVKRTSQASYDSLIDCLKQCRIVPTKVCLNVLRQISTSLDSHGFESSVTTSICFRTLVLPWVQANYGMAKATELKAHAEGA